MGATKIDLTSQYGSHTLHSLGQFIMRAKLFIGITWSCPTPFPHPIKYFYGIGYVGVGLQDQSYLGCYLS